MEGGTDLLADEARRRVVEGTARPVFWKGAQVGEVRQYNDRLLMFLLQARRPQVYQPVRAAQPRSVQPDDGAAGEGVADDVLPPHLALRFARARERVASWRLGPEPVGPVPGEQRAAPATPRDDVRRVPSLAAPMAAADRPPDPPPASPDDTAAAPQNDIRHAPSADDGADGPGAINEPLPPPVVADDEDPPHPIEWRYKQPTSAEFMAWQNKHYRPKPVKDIDWSRSLRLWP